jgi:hypothetical protein
MLHWKSLRSLSNSCTVHFRQELILLKGGCWEGVWIQVVCGVRGLGKRKTISLLHVILWWRFDIVFVVWLVLCRCRQMIISFGSNCFVRTGYLEKWRRLVVRIKSFNGGRVDKFNQKMAVRVNFGETKRSDFSCLWMTL